MILLRSVKIAGHAHKVWQWNARLSKIPTLKIAPSYPRTFVCLDHASNLHMMQFQIGGSCTYYTPKLFI